MLSDGTFGLSPNETNLLIQLQLQLLYLSHNPMYDFSLIADTNINRIKFTRNVATIAALLCAIPLGFRDSIAA